MKLWLGPFLFGFFVCFGEARTFSNTAGTKIEAEIVEVNGDKVVLKMKGKNYSIPVATLSAEDQKFISDWAANAEPESTANWDGEWPRLISADISQDIEILKEDGDKFIYASDHYEFHCNVGLKKSVVKRFALLFEATNLYMRELPLGMEKPFQEKRFRIDLWETKADFMSNGGPATAAGIYFSGKDIVSVPLSSLGVKKVGSTYSVDHDVENGTLSHEICHQLTDRQYYRPGSNGWFTEGLAEYIKCSGYRSGKFNVNDLRRLKEYVTAYGEDGKGGRAIGTDVRMPKFEHWATQSYSEFLNDPQRNYGVGGLVVYYFFHMDQEKDAANIKAFLKEMKKGTKPPEVFGPLLNGRSFDELEADITKSWRSRGIKINWGG